MRAYGSDTLAYFALRARQELLLLRATGEAMIAYTYVSGYALVAADPIGAPGSEDAVLDEFLGFCRERAWHVAFLAVREDDLAALPRPRLHRRLPGRRGHHPLRHFNLEAPADEARALGGQPRRPGAPLPAPARVRRLAARCVEELNAIRERWRGKAPERGFTMELGQTVRGRAAGLPARRRLRGGRAARSGFLRLVPCYGTDPGYSLDLMQHDPDAANGMTEFLIANAALALGERGFRRLSMNFAAWGRLFDTGADLTPAQRAQSGSPRR